MITKSVASSIARAIAGSVCLPSLSSAFVFVYQSISVLVEDGSNNPRLLAAANITRIGYWQLFGGIRATPGSIAFTPVDLSSAGAEWESGGIFDLPVGTLRIDLPVHAMIGNPDQIEIQITPTTGTVVIDNPVVNV